MPRPSPHLSLRAPTPSQNTLSFCEANPRDLKRWISTLPKANIGETARLLYQGMAELNQLVTPTENRLQLLELLRPEVYYVCKQLERHFLNQAIVLDERARKVANLCQALQNHLAAGYKIIVVRVASASREHSTALAIAVQRAIHCLFGSLVRASLLYCPVPDRLWLELHNLYLAACEHKVQHTSVADGLAHNVKALTSEQAYVAALLMGCSRCNQMRQSAIMRLAELLESWSHLARIQSALAADSLFAVAPGVDGPPRYKSLFEDGQLPDLLGLNTTLLAHSIQEYLALPVEQRPQARLPVPAGFSTDLLQHVGAAWGDVAERTFNRTPGQGNLTVCIGMSAMHYYLGGERTFGEQLGLPGSSTSAQFSALGKQGVWGPVLEAPALEEIEYQSPGAGNAGRAREFPTYSLHIVNHSPGGYCLAWRKEVPSQLQAGELVGIQDAPSHGWSVAVVRWIRQVRDGGTQMGIELIAPHAQPCGLQLVRGNDPHSEYLRGLMLPEIRAIDIPPTLLAPRLPFQEGHKLVLNNNGDEHRAQLLKRLANTGSFNQFEYRLADQPGPQATPVVPEAAGREEDFNSLWRDL
jgi:hypothetical protein